MNPWWIVLGLAFALRGAAETPPTPADSADVPARLNLGRPATPEEIARWDIAVRPDGRGLPKGGGNAAQGAPIYLAKCMACHGPAGEGVSGVASQLISPPREKFDFAISMQAEKEKTIGNYWPYATTVFDYVRRAMPFNAPGSLTADEIYALTAFLLMKNGVIPEAAEMNARSLPLVRMPAQSRFVPDDRLKSNRVR